MDGNTCLHILAEIDDISLIKLMLPFCRDSLNRKNDKGKLPYHLAKGEAVDLLRINDSTLISRWVDEIVIEDRN